MATFVCLECSKTQEVTMSNPKLQRNGKYVCGSCYRNSPRSAYVVLWWIIDVSDVVTEGYMEFPIKQQAINFIDKQSHGWTGYKLFRAYEVRLWR